jgi:hypothetical protein
MHEPIILSGSELKQALIATLLDNGHQGIEDITFTATGELLKDAHGGDTITLDNPDLTVFVKVNE